MQISLERDAGRQRRPVYRQIADQIRGEIDAGRLNEGAVYTAGGPPSSGAGSPQD